MAQKIKENSLSIRLAEAAVFLRSDYTHSRRNNDSSSSRDSLLRGLLVMELAKPTRITNIEAELTAVASISVPEGIAGDFVWIGARRLDTVEHHRVFHTSTILFRSSAPGSYPQKTLTAITSDPHRRSASIGPGVSYSHRSYQNTEISRADLEDHLESDEISCEGLLRSQHTHTTSANYQSGQSTPSPARLPSASSHDLNDLGRNRRLSVEKKPLSTSRPPPLPSPPYSLPSPTEDHSSFLSPTTPSSSMIRRPSFTETILESDSELPRSNETKTDTTSTHGSSDPHRESVSLHDSQSINSASSSDQQRGRLHSRTPAAHRFSLSAVPNILLGAVGSASPRRSLVSPGNENEVSIQREKSIGRSPASIIRGRLEGRRRTETRGSTPDSIPEGGGSSISRERSSKERTSVLSKLLGDKEEWSQEFKPGTYTYPITFSIPSSAQPTLHAEYGSISWKLRAAAHRPGTFHSKLAAEREVIVVACPTEEDIEDTESIIVERNWAQQMQYLISISGRAFFIGGTIPISIALMPLNKVKVHRIEVYIEEKVDYFSRFLRLVRSDPPLRINLLSIRNQGNNLVPILPLESKEIFRSSPLFGLLDPEERRDASRLDELAADFMGPGPWRFQKDLKIPDSCKLMKLSNKTLETNIRIGHMLKVILRLEKAPLPSEEDSHKAKPALFDIIVQSPVLILSCRLNPEWASLPRYTDVDMVHDIIPTCPCRARQQSPSSFPRSSAVSTPSESAEPPTTRSSPLANANDSRSHSPHSEYTESMIRSSSLFERLVSGQESETGEAPPAYGYLNDGADGQGSSSVSVAIREVPLTLARRQNSEIFI